MDGIVSEYQSIEQRFETLSDKLAGLENQFQASLSTQMDRVKGEFASMDQRLSDIRAEILRYEVNQKIFSKNEEMIKKVDEAVQHYHAVLKGAKDEAKNLEKFMEDIDKIKDLRKNVEREIKVFESRRDKVTSFESEITGLMQLTDIVVQKAESMEIAVGKIDQVNTRIDALSEGYANLEMRIRELHDYEETIAKNLESVQKADVLIKTIDGKINGFRNIIDKSDRRVQKLNQYLQSIEENTLVLKTREQEIRDVRDKFTELEGLSSHMEKRIDQIHAMFKKVETMRLDIDDADSKLKDLFTQTDLKMKQFADFLTAVEGSNPGNPITRQIKGDAPLGKNINEGMIKTVRELSRKGWSSNEISSKLMIDENSVRLIINTASL
jgi:chromosome segregation ATPase